MSVLRWSTEVERRPQGTREVFQAPHFPTGVSLTAPLPTIIKIDDIYACTRYDFRVGQGGVSSSMINAWVDPSCLFILPGNSVMLV
jgi:hypothetical protein